MIDGPLCIIPARGGSKRFPRKNIAMLAGKTLLAHAIEAAVASEVFCRICVSSDSDEILRIAEGFDTVEAMKRPHFLATDTAQVKDVCVHLIEHLAAQGHRYTEFCVLSTTNPLRSSEDIRQAYDVFRRQDGDFLMSLVPYSHPPQVAVWVPSGFVEPYFGSEHMKPAQLLDQAYRHDGSIILGKCEAFLAGREFYGNRVLPYFSEPDRSVDIDTPLDLAWAEFLLNRPGPLLEEDKRGDV